MSATCAVSVVRKLPNRGAVCGDEMGSVRFTLRRPPTALQAHPTAYRNTRSSQSTTEESPLVLPSRCKSRWHSPPKSTLLDRLAMIKCSICPWGVCTPKTSRPVEGLSSLSKHTNEVQPTAHRHCRFVLSEALSLPDAKGWAMPMPIFAIKARSCRAACLFHPFCFLLFHFAAHFARSVRR